MGLVQKADIRKQQESLQKAWKFQVLLIYTQVADMHQKLRILEAFILLGVLITCGIARGSAKTDDLNLTPVKKKLIATGWEFEDQTPQDLQNIMKELADGPFDGVVLSFNVLGDQGKLCNRTTVTDGRMWKKEWFAQDVQSLKSASSKKLTDNFLLVWISPTTKASGVKTIRMPWNDDKRWAAFANNMGVLAWVAKQGGLKGLTIDPEDYGGVRQYEFRPSDGDYNSTARLARARGAQVMQAIAKEYPDITLLFYWLLSVKPKLYMTQYPSQAVENENDLWTPFVNGMLDVLPPMARLVDGTERAYLFKDYDFAISAAQIRNNCLNLIAPENRAKYRTQVQAGFGLYIDAHLNPKTSRWYQPPLDGFRRNRLCQNVIDALSAADEYVWLYGQQGEWADWQPKSGASHNKYRLWDELMPGIENAIKLAKSPDYQGRQEVEALRASGELMNLAANPGFEDAARSTGANTTPMPAKWALWQSAKSKGTFSLDTQYHRSGRSSVKAAGVDNGCILQAYTVKPGEWYEIEGMGLFKGAGNYSMTVRWQDSSGDWSEKSKDRDIFFGGPTSDWLKAFGTVQVPSGADKLVLLIMIHQPSDADMAWFDKAGVYKLP